jgi:putative serine esterase DUF676
MAGLWRACEMSCVLARKDLMARLALTLTLTLIHRLCVGAVVARSALDSPAMTQWLPLLHAYISLAGPHLGTPTAEKNRVLEGLLFVGVRARTHCHSRYLIHFRHGTRSQCINTEALYKNVTTLYPAVIQVL